ncbi:glycosyltransferase [Cyanobium sp. ATX 6A2]|uniref:glycosyltransferase n=1 Tax=Cyanobium sp. ATX 6A2 TaxID=2823700 RepID=UPI0020CC13AB|nr:glycosyltransferase [Cyanobium sp. ATX 6A2]
MAGSVLVHGTGAGEVRWAAPLLVLAWALWLRRRPEVGLPMAARRSAIVLIALLSLSYLVWRASSTLNLSTTLATAISLTMLAAEAALLGHGLLQLALAWYRQPPVAKEAEQAALRLAQLRGHDPQALPAVDVLVPCCGEPLELVQRTLGGCLALAYPRLTVWLLDDGDRSELAALCSRLGCRYRSRADPRQAKAGNLNQVLPELAGDLVAVFDADVVPQHDFLSRCVGLFDDPRVGLVQTPQSYMNADPVIRNLGLERWLMPDEEYFYRWIEPIRQGVGAVVCAGTSFVMRRRALVRVGGFETATSSEDLATGIRLSAAGYRCVYLNEKLSAGLAPSSLEAMARQRSRWASGTLQILRTSASPLTIPGLSPLQRLAYLEGILHWLSVVPQLLLLLLPLSFGLLRVPPLVISDDGWLTLALPMVVAQLLLVRWFSRGSRSALLPELYRWVFLAPLLRAVLSTLVGRPLRFRVTPKTAPPQRLAPAAPLAAPLVGLLALQLFNLLLLLRGPAPALPPVPALPLVWSALAILSLLAALKACWDRPGRGLEVWFQPLAAAVWLEQSGQRWPARLTAISEQGVELAWRRAGDHGPEPDLQRPLHIEAPALAGDDWQLLAQRLERRGQQVRLGAGWLVQSAAARERRQTLLYRQCCRWPMRQAPPEPRALLAVLVALLRPLPAQGWFRRSVLPIQLAPPAAAPELVS